MRGARAFTLVELLIVILILGVLAAIVVPQFTSAADESAATTTYNELQKLRRAIEVYRARHSNSLPPVEEGDGTWGPLANNSEYLRSSPINQWVSGENGQVIVFGNAPDDAFQTDYGWIFDPATGNLWAGSYNSLDQPLPKP